MRKYVIKRLLQLIPILFAITFLSFGMMRLAGSDVVQQKMENTGAVVSQEVVDAAREELGLDKPFVVQYFIWLGNLLRGDMGNSYVSGRDVFTTFLSFLLSFIFLQRAEVQKQRLLRNSDLTLLLSFPLFNLLFIL